MAKLFAEIENEEGKRVSLGSNQGISCTVYEGNKKQYSVYIEWGDIGDIIDNDGNELPESEKTKGATVTVKEWRNEPDARRTRKNECPNGGLHRWYKPYTNEETLKCVMCDRVKE